MTHPDHLIDRKEIETLLKKSRALTADLLQMPHAPKVVARINKGFFYDRADTLVWLASDPYQRHRLVIESTKAATPARTDRARPSTLDQTAALAFLTQAATPFVGPVKVGRSTVVHLVERNDYIPPHSVLSGHRSHSAVEYRGLSLMGVVMG